MDKDITRRIAALSATKKALLERRLSEDLPSAVAKELVAYLVPQGDAVPAEPELRTYLREKLPDYMVPSAFVLMDMLPVTPSGKLDRNALPAPRLPSDREGAALVPRTDLEQLVAGIWSEVLQQGPVGVGENFFTLGGHSLAATRVVSRLNAVLGVEVPVSAMFEAPTVAELARRLQALLHGTQQPAMPPIQRTPRTGVIPLSFAQQRLWFLDQLQPETAAYNLPAAMRLEGVLDAGALERAIEASIHRHEVLRTTFPGDAGEPFQYIHPAQQYHLPVADISGLPPEEREAALEKQIHEEAGRPFDLARGPLIRALLLRLGPEDHVLLCTLHHIVADGWSIDVLMRELSACYRAFLGGQAPALPELPIQYADYALWQREWLTGDALEQQLVFWKQALADAPTTLDLPTDRPRPAVQRFVGRRLPLALSRQLTDKLHELCRQENATLFMLLLASFSTLLARYTQQRDILIGAPIANRVLVETEGLIGFFVNTLVLRTDLSGEPTVRELLQRVRGATLAALAHQDVPFETLVEALAPQRELSRTPLFQVMLALENAPLGGLELPGMTARALELENATAKFDLELIVTEAPDGLRGVLEYNTDLFDSATIERMANHFVRLVEEMAANPSASVFRLPMLGETERRYMLEEINRSELPVPHESTFPELFSARAHQTPAAVAAVSEGVTWSYGELEARANRIAHTLLAEGLQPEDIVGLHGERSLAFLAAMIGIFKAGGAYMPLDPAHPPARLRQVLEDSKTRIVLATERTAPRLREALASEGLHDLPVLVIEDLFQRPAPETPPEVRCWPRQLAYVLFTSGSTGVPKGAMLQHDGMLNHLYCKVHDLDLVAGDALAQNASQSFDISIWQFLTALVVGGRVHIYPDHVAHDALDLLDAAIRDEVTILEVVPSMARMMLDALEDSHPRDLSRLRWLILTGEALPPALARRWMQRYPEPPLLNAYGPTECSDDVTHYAFDTPPAEAVDHMPIGRPVANMKIYILDRHLEPVPLNIHGELYVGGIGVGRGYLGRPALTAQAFVPDPFAGDAGARLYRTGDLARWRPDPAGKYPIVEFLGRVDHQVKIRGYRIELGEIEAVLGRHERVRAVGVLVREDQPGVRRLVAYVVPDSSAELPIADLRAHLRDSLPEYMVPSVFVFLDELPLTPNGKTDRKALERIVPADSGTAVFREPPSNRLERELAAIWADVLGIASAGIHDNFFELGGDSLLAIQMVARARRVGLELTPRQIFQHQTIAEQAKVVGTVPAIMAEQGLVQGPVPLTPAQRWFFEQPLETPAHWNLALLLEVRRALDPALIEKAVEALLAHHDALRLRFRRTDAGWEQECKATAAGLPFQHVDLSTHAQPLRALEETAAALQSSLDLTGGPLLRVALVRLGADHGDRLLLLAHHLVVDAVSWRILLEDLLTAYEQLAAGQDVRLPPKTTSFKAWAERLVQHASEPALAEERAYWSSQPWAQAEPIPVDGDQGNTEASLASVEISLDETQTRALLHEVPEAYRTQVEDVLIAALGQAFGRHAGIRRLLVDVEGHGREPLFDDIDLSRTVGWFTSFLPVLLDCTTGRGEADVIKTTKQQLREIPNRGIGYGILRYLSQRSAESEAVPALQPEVCFNYFGQIDRALPSSAPFALAPESTGASRAPGNRRKYLLDVTARIVDQQLKVMWIYGEGTHHRETIEALARAFVAALGALIAHCRSPGAGGYTPSDFPLARLGQAELDELADQGRSLEDIYPLSPMQQGFWLYSQYAGEARVGVEQIRFILEGRLQQDVFARAWQSALDRHPVLRTGFVSEGLHQPLQVVHRNVALTFATHSLRGLPGAEQEARLQTFLADDLRRGFALDTPPLMRVSVIELAEEVHQVVWSHHHLLLDGWSVPIVLREVIAFYEAHLQGSTLELERPRPYRDYIAWYQGVDLAATRAFWERELAGVRAPTPLVLDRSTEERAAPGHREEWLALPADETAALEDFARHRQLSLSTLLHAAWARVLGRYSGTHEVMFGTTVSGRPSNIDGVEAMVGLFINIVPVRVQLPAKRSVLDWLRQLHTRLLEQRQYELAPLIQIQQWSEVSASQPLFDSLLVIENYPTRLPDQKGGAATEMARGLAVRDVDEPVRTRYRITLVAVPGTELAFHVSYDGRQLAPASMRRLLGHLRTVLASFVSAPEKTLGEVSILTAEERAWLDVQSRTERLLDADGQPVPVGIPGEVHRGEDLQPTGRMARYLPDGQREPLGTRDDRVELGGQWVLPGEIAALLSAIPGVRECSVHASGDTLVAYVVPAGAQPERQTLVDHLREQLAPSFVPGAFVFVPELPRDAAGEINRAQLPAPQPEDFTSAREHIPPRTLTEQALARIWSELVGDRSIGVQEDFFELGGQSLLAIQMLSRVRTTLGVDLPMHVVFTERTLEAIARWIDTHGVASPEEVRQSPFERSPLERIPPQPSYELSPYQLPEWFFTRLAPDSPMYNILSCDILLEGDIDLDVMVRAWQLLVDRHGVFRTSFGWENGKPIQRIRPSMKVTREDIYLDYTDTPEEDFVAVSTRLAHEYAAQTFDFSTGPVHKLTFAEFPGKRFLLLFLTNHIIWDEVSHINMVSELKEAYDALWSGRTPALPDLKIDYVDYAHWVNRGVESGLFERERQYWLQRFAVTPPPLELPSDFPRPQQPTFNGSDVEAKIPHATKNELQAFLHEHPGITFSMVLHATFALLLYRLSGQNDLVIGIPVSNRGDQRLERIIGPFATAMPMRSELDGSMTFAELLGQTQREMVTALENYAYPSVLAIQQINPRWEISRGRLFQVMYGLQHNKTRFWEELQLPGVRTRRVEHLSSIGPLHSTARTDLSLIVEELGDDILFSLSYSADLFKRSTAERMVQQYLTLLDQALRRPETPLDALRLLPAEDRARIIDSFNDTDEALPIDGSICGRIHEQAARTPDAPALLFEGKQWTYAELDAEANRWAHQLLSLGVRMEDRVGLLFEPSPEMVISILAVMKTGAAYVPLHPDQPPARWQTILDSAGARVLLTHPVVDTAALAFAGTRLDVAPGAATAWPAGPLDIVVPPRGGAVVFFTSGSTGLPKGIEVEHRGVLNLIESTQRVYGLQQDEAILLTTPYTFDVSMLDLFWPLMVGARLVVPRGADGKTPSRISALVDAHRVAFLQCVPLMLAALVDGRATGEVSSMSSLRTVMCAGAVLTRELYERCVSAFSFVLVNHYGPTEASVDVSRFDPRGGFDGDVVPIGKPIANTRLYVLDDQLAPVPIGVTGELYISGAGLARGYLNDPAKTARSFLPDPFSPQPGARMYRTGDLAHWDEDGVLHFVGRVDRQVKVRGNRVEIEEIETQLYSHPAVRRCVIQHKRAPQGDDFLVAYVEPREQANGFLGDDRSLRLFTLAQRPELRPAMDALHVDAWPAYFAGDEVQQLFWPRLVPEMPHTQLAMVDASDQVVAVGNAVPIHWDGTVDGLPRGWDGGLAQAFHDADAGVAPNTLLVLAGVVSENQAGQGLSAFILRAFKALARGLGLARVLVPVRPTGKVDHPELGFEDWCNQRRPDGLAVDPWLRVHERLGARRLKIDLVSQHIRAPLARWEQWSGQRIDRSGPQHLPGTLQPVLVNVEEGFAEYFDPSVWVEHPLDAGPADIFDPLDGKHLREFLRRSLPDYMIPEHYRFLRAMPLTTSGKIDENALPPFQLTGSARSSSLPPQTPLQVMLTAAVRAVLEVESLGVQDDFFELGGNSLKALQLLARLADEHGVHVPARQFFKEPTIKGLESVIQAAERTPPVRMD